MTDSIVSYTLERSPDGQTWTVLRTFNGTATSFDDPSPLSPQSFYRLTGTSANGLTVPYDIIQVNVIPIPATAGTLTSVKAISSSIIAESWAVGTDATGAVIVGGDFVATINDGIHNDTVGSGLAGFICKYNVTGDPQWLRTFKNSSGGSNTSVRAVSVDSGGNILAAGYYQGTVDFGNGFVLNSLGGSLDVFVAKYDPNNVCVWSKNFGGVGVEQCYAMATGDGNKVALAFNTSGSPQVIFGSITLVPPQANSVCIGKIDSSGNSIWAKTFGASTSVDIRAITVERITGHVYVTGRFSGTIDFGAGVFTSDSSFWVAKYDAIDGHLLWGALAPGATGFGMDTDLATGNLYIVGDCIASTNFGLGEVNGGYFLASYTPDGDINWVQSWGASGPNDHGFGVAAGSNLVAIVGVASNSTPDFSGVGNFLIGNGNSNLYIASFSVTDNIPTYRWSFRAGIGMGGTSAANACRIDSLGNVCLTGTQIFGINYDPATTIAAGNGQVWSYIARYAA